jgi:hypothetical protein
MTLRDLRLIDIPQYEASVKRLEETVSSEQRARRDAVAAEQKATQAVTIERDTWKSQAEFYKSALAAKNQGRSTGCWFKKILTFGISGCR